MKLHNRVTLFCVVLQLLVMKGFAFGSMADTLLIGQRTLAFTDPERNREIKMEIWYPALNSGREKSQELKPAFHLSPTLRNAEVSPQAHPLILLSHGTGGGRLTLEWFAAGLVAKGYIVAAADHWGNTYDNPIPEYFLRVWERPLDISRALTFLLSHQDFYAAIDSNRIGMAGFSLGGFTALALAGADYDPNALMAYTKTPQGRQEASIPEFPDLPKLMEDSALSRKLFQDYAQVKNKLKDSRIKAVFVMAPALGQGFPGKESFRAITIPVSIVGANKDTIAPPSTNALYYHRMIPHSQYHLLGGETGHFVFMNAAKKDLQEEIPHIFKDHPSVRRPEIHRQVLALAATFFEKAL